MKDSVQKEEKSTTQADDSDPKTMRILITDDSTAIRHTIREKLAELTDDDSSLVIHEAETGEQALRLARSHTYDVIFLDVEMPGLDGLETCRRIKEFSDARVVMLSSLDSGTDHSAGRDAGCDNYLVKPPNDSDLRVILRLVSIRKLTQN